MAELVIRGTVATMTAGAAPGPGAVWIRDGRIVGVTHGHTTKSGFAGASTVDVGDAFVLPGLIDMHNHLGVQHVAVVVRAGADRTVAAQPPLDRREHLHAVDHRTRLRLREGGTGGVARLRPGARTRRRGDRGAGLADRERRLRHVVRNVDAEDAGTGAPI